MPVATQGFSRGGWVVQPPVPSVGAATVNMCMKDNGTGNGMLELKETGRKVKIYNIYVYRRVGNKLKDVFVCLSTAEHFFVMCIGACSV